MASARARLGLAAAGLSVIAGLGALLSPAPRRPASAPVAALTSPAPVEPPREVLPPAAPPSAAPAPAPAPLAPTPSPREAFAAAPELDGGPGADLQPFDPNAAPPAAPPAAPRPWASGTMGPAPEDVPAKASGECLISHRWGINSKGRGATLDVTVDGRPHTRRVFSSAELAAGTVTWIRIPDDSRDHTVVFAVAVDHGGRVPSTGRSTFVGRGLGTWRALDGPGDFR
jgi:hypothetical protein